MLTPQKKLFDFSEGSQWGQRAQRRSNKPTGHAGRAAARQGAGRSTPPKKGNEAQTQTQTQGILDVSGRDIFSKSNENQRPPQITTGSSSRSYRTFVDNSDERDEPQPDTSMLRQPETRPISHDQLVVEVKGIYAGLVMVEAKCIEVDEQQTREAMSQRPPGTKMSKLTDDQWKSLIALHKQLLHEHHDFFLASQHPSASINLSRLAGKYSMPARMWRHGIHGFLEVLRHRLPSSFEHMLTFIVIAYSMMALLYETVPTFEDTWVECLGDLARYRMAIEEEEIRDRETWSGVARYWYAKASDRAPHVGRLYHHLAILAKPWTTEQMSLYLRALTCVTPFESARGSVLTLFDPALKGEGFPAQRVSEFELRCIQAHGILFKGQDGYLNNFAKMEKQILAVVGSYVRDAIRYPGNQYQPNKYKLRKALAYLAISNVAGILGYGMLTADGHPKFQTRRVFDIANHQRLKEAHALAASKASDDKAQVQPDEPQGPAHMAHPLSEEDAKKSSEIVQSTSRLNSALLDWFLSTKHWDTDGEISFGKDQWTHFLGFIHIDLVFILAGLQTRSISSTFLDIFNEHVPWTSVCLFLNQLVSRNPEDMELAFQDSFPRPKDSLPLWEDFSIRGSLYAVTYYPENYFTDFALDDEERQLETAGMDAWRIVRILYVGHCIAKVCQLHSRPDRG